MEKVRLEYKVIKTRNGQTGFVKLGTGNPLIMLVGYSGNLLHWNSELIYSLAEQYTLYLIDNRRVGLSDSYNDESMTGFADDVADFIDALNLNNPLICGWSMGGIIAQALVIKYPNLVKGIGLIVSQPDYSYTYGALHKLVADLRNKPSKENRDKLTELFFSGIPSIEFRKYLAKTILPINHYIYPFGDFAQQLQDKAVSEWHTDYVALKQVKTPVLIAVAKNDSVTKPEASNILHQILSNSKLISYSDGGHFFLHYYPHDLATQIKLFFSALL